MHQIDEKAALRDRRLMSVGSVLHLARDGDVIWGAGVNGKVPDNCYHFRTLDVRSVRGPKTRDFLSRRGINAPTIFGDPVLLLPIVMPELTSYAQVKRHSLTVVPNFNDFAAYASTPELLNPRLPVDVCLRRIAQSELVVGSSLHGIVVAESMGVPARLVRSSVEDQFKYQDYYLGTGRPESKAARTIDEAVRMGGERPPIFDPAKLLAAFPLDLWGAR